MISGQTKPPFPSRALGTVTPILKLICLCILLPGAARALVIQLNPDAGLATNPQALAAFERAAAEWETAISSPVTIYIDAGLAAVTDPNVIGATSIKFYTNDFSDINLDFDTVRNAMAARAGRPGDTMLGYLPTSAQVSADVPSGALFLSDTIGVLRANQRALGLLAPLDTRADAGIVFNSNFSFDYDNSDGVAANRIDFQTAAAHEIGHALGFQSDVDDFDEFSAPSDNLTTLDLFRFPASHKPTTLEQFTSYARELKPGVASVLTDTSLFYPMSTGKNLGDGRQASHWQDDFIAQNGNITAGPLIGIMDPTAATFAEGQQRRRRGPGLNRVRSMFLPVFSYAFHSPPGQPVRASF